MDKRYFLQEVLGLDNTLTEEVLTLAIFSKVRKGACLIYQGEEIVYLNLLLTGIFRGYIVDKDGKEITDCLMFRPGDSLMPNTDLSIPATCTIEAMADSEIMSLSLTEVSRLLREHPSLFRIYQRLVVLSTKQHWTLKYIRYLRDAGQRWTWFQKNFPLEVQRIGDKHIASYLDISPVHLSRLKHRDQPAK